MRSFVALVAATFVVTACTSAAGPSAAPSAGLPSPTAQETTEPTPLPSPSGEPWDLLWISDSTGSGGVPAEYGKRIEADLGIPVRVHDGWKGGMSIVNVLYLLRGGEDGVLYSWGSGAINLFEVIPAAEVIVVSGNPGESEDPAHPFGGCTPEAPAEPPSTDPLVLARYEADIVAVFDEIFRIRDGEPVILRTHDWYLPWAPRQAWEEAGQVPECAESLRGMSEAIHRAAAARDVPVASYLAAFSGPDGDHPLPSAWLVEDGVHPSREGASHLADVVADLGYEPVSPPGG